MSNNDPLIGKQLGDYTIEKLLGQGGMARVYKGYDSRLDRYAAVKVIVPTLSTDDDEGAEYRERFQREARAIAKLHHPNVVNIFQFGDFEDLYYMAMSFVEGRDLRQIIKEHNKQGKLLSNAQILRIIRDIAEALDYSHLQGVIHRDIKPSNIMMQADGHAVLTDFGLALNAQEGTIGNTFGSVHYIAPEQAVSSAQAVPQSDLYSLGVVLFEMITGRVPFEDVSAMSVALKHISDPPPPPTRYNPNVSKEVEDVIIKSLDKDPRNRYKTGLMLVHALEGAFALNDEEDTHDLIVNFQDVPAIEPKPTHLLNIDEVPTTAISPDFTPSSDISNDSSPSLSGTLPFSPLDDAKSRETQSKISTALIGSIVVLVLISILATGVIYSGGLGIGDNSTATPTLTLTRTATNTVTLTPSQTMTVTNTATLTPTSTLTNTATLTPSQTATSTSTLTPTPTLTNTATLTPSQTATSTSTLTPTPTLTNTATLTSTATSTPTPTPIPTNTLPPTMTPTPEINPASPDEPQVLLRYDGRSLVLYNRAGENISLRNIEFIQERPDNEDGSPKLPYVFEASRWQSGIGNISSVESQHCYQVFTLEQGTLGANQFPADICESRRGVFTTTNPFWVHEVNEAPRTFTVKRLGRVIATCTTVTRRDDLAEERCLVELPRR